MSALRATADEPSINLRVTTDALREFRVDVSRRANRKTWEYLVWRYVGLGMSQGSRNGNRARFRSRERGLEAALRDLVAWDEEIESAS